MKTSKDKQKLSFLLIAQWILFTHFWAPVYYCKQGHCMEILVRDTVDHLFKLTITQELPHYMQLAILS